MTELSDFVCDSIDEFFGNEDYFDKLLSSVGQEELDRMLENSGALVAAALQPHPSFKKAALGDLQQYKDKNRNKNTEQSTSTWVNRFESWRQWRNVPSKLEEIPREELDNTLQLFYAELRKADGTDYESGSLRMMLAALDRHLHENGAKFSIIKDRHFEESRKILNGKAIELRQQGKGKGIKQMQSQHLRKNSSGPGK